ncbi:SdpI family protein [Bacillus thuringiensis]|uniref:SdpI family protein n=2 Tax=Bacillus cereus group TaxID=86661 RepID=A0A9X6WMU2_BACTU|nr:MULTISPECIES: SdpI family protein [Bacillus]MBK5496854.1 SdpI family protein [Bacillus sp. TH13]MCC6081095.1 SdpI family protein [Bacillus thuringiensis]MED1903689.1 SdpI family protein [Bacillus thuringiensis]MED3352493.1 SdpI family protein [Bacillus thuringiensis]MEE3959171.1 SdpI family protein [Bacillus thuringiensis]
MIDALVNIGISILIGIIFILAAIILQKNPPNDINAAYGYRTKRSMKNKELWDAGNRYSAEVMKQNGFIMMLIGSVISILFRYPHTIIAIMVVMLLLIIRLFIQVENKLKILEQ